MKVEEFVKHVAGARRTSRGWIARCPAHGDRSPSLSISQGHDERILIHCFSGCTVEEVCSALRLSMRDLFPIKDRASPLVLRRRHRQREAARHVEEIGRHHQGAVIDLHREAENLIRSARDIDITQWSNNRLNEELDRLADAHEILRREGNVYESC